MTASRKRGAVLECKHVRYYRLSPPHLLERVWCTECSDMRRIVTWEGWFYARCVSCRATFTRSSVEVLGRNAKRHRCYRPSFRYWVWRNGWERISESFVFALDSDPLWTDTDTTQAGAGPASVER